MDPATAPLPSAIDEPVPRHLLALLRRAVLDHATREHRRVYPAVVHVGWPGGPTATVVLGDQQLDQALRTDAIHAMVRSSRAGRATPPGTLVWLTRPGTLEVRDADLAWLAATRSAAAELGQALPMVVVNRRSWRDPSTGVHRAWVRLRAPGAG